MSAVQNLSDRRLVLRDLVVPRLEAEGYEVVLDPPPGMLPAFFGDYRPDAVALGGDRKLAIDVGGLSRRSRALHVPRFPEGSGWEHRLIFAPETQGSIPLGVVPDAQIDAALDRILPVFDAFGAVPAILMGWSVLEAVARSLLPAKASRGQPAATLIETLLFEGIVTPRDGELLRRVGDVRNVAAHGQLDATMARADVERFVGVLRAARAGS